MRIYSHEEIKRLPGLVEVVSERFYRKSSALSRSTKSMPKGLTPGGKVIFEKRDVESDTGRKVSRYLVLWHVNPDPKSNGGAA